MRVCIEYIKSNQMHNEIMNIIMWLIASWLDWTLGLWFSTISIRDQRSTTELRMRKNRENSSIQNSECVKS